MPTHDGNDYTVGILEDDFGNRTPLAKGQISELDLRPNGNANSLPNTGFADGTFYLKTSSKNWRMLVREVHKTLPYWMTNNWRRMHHLKMRRNVIGRNWKRRKYHDNSQM